MCVLNIIRELAKFKEILSEIINKLSSGINKFYTPIHEKRMANAKSHSEIVKVQTQLKIKKMKLDFDKKIKTQSDRFETNSKKIFNESIKNIEMATLTPSDSTIETEWFDHFFEKSKTISDEQMQQIWAKILAGEISKTSKFSKKTLSILQDLTKEDAELFEEVCRCTWEMNRSVPIIILNDNKINYLPEKINFENLLLLEEKGLIHFSPAPAGFTIYFNGSIAEICYFSKKMLFESTEKEFTLYTGSVTFTDAGKQLYKIYKGDPNLVYMDSIINYLKSSGFKITII